jgi:hypothetical protein
MVLAVVVHVDFRMVQGELILGDHGTWIIYPSPGDSRSPVPMVGGGGLF